VRKDHDIAHNLYVTGTEPQSGKSIVALGMMEMLSGRVARLGYFRPIIPSRAQPDSQIELIRRRYKLRSTARSMHALSEDEASQIGDYEELRKAVVSAYKAIERRCDFVLCEGTDFGGAVPALDFGRNADLANELGAPVLVVVKGGGTPEKTLASVHAARASLRHKGCTVFGALVNRVAKADAAGIRDRLAAEEGEDAVYVVPELPELTYPTVGEVASALAARIHFRPGETLQREVRDVSIAAMGVEHFVEGLGEGTLVIVPGDRADILAAAVASAASPAIPTVSGVLLAGAYPLSGKIRALLRSAPFPVLEVERSAHDALVGAQAVQPRLRAENERKLAVVLGHFEAAVDTEELESRIALERPLRTTPLMFEYELLERARKRRKHIVLPEGDDDRVLRAAEILLRRRVVDLTILGDPGEVRARAAALGVDVDAAPVVDPLASPDREDYAARYFELRKHRGMTEELAYDMLGDPSYFGTMAVHVGAVDGMVSGAAHSTGDTIRPAFEIIRAREGVSVVSSVFFMCLSDRVLVYGDCAVNPSPDTAQLADIAVSSAETAASFGVEPRIAMLSYSTGDSARGPGVDAVREATELVRERRPDLPVEGPIQYDAAVDATVAKVKLPESLVAGQATVFVFPDLDTGNIAYKAVQRSAKAVAIGPVLQGLRKPVNDLSRGCTVTDIVNTVAVTAVQAGTRGSSGA